MALTNKLSAIGDAIRSKTGTTELMTLDAMPAAIEAIQTGGGGDLEIPPEAFIFTGDCQYRFSNNSFIWFIDQCGSRITTKDINNASNMFYNSNKLKTIPFDINFRNGGCYCTSMFSGCDSLESVPSIDFKQTNNQAIWTMFQNCFELREIGKLSNLYPNTQGMSSMFNGCHNLRYLPEFENLNLEKAYSGSYFSFSSLFESCYSLRSIPEEFLKRLYVPLVKSNSSPVCYRGFRECFTLDEIRGLNPQTGTITSNMFPITFESCHRLKDIVFAAQEDGTPYSVNWSNQSISLQNTGYITNHLVQSMTMYNSGITLDKEVTDDATYQALKNDPDWFTMDAAYSRYNHDSAVNTINTLPDVTQGSGNTITFNGAAGSATDGGAINTLTEEEIAVAAAKGWTVTFA